MTKPTPTAPTNVLVEALDLSRDDHSRGFQDLLDHYARDPMGGGKALDPALFEVLVPRLRERIDFVGFIASIGGTPCGLINCFEGFSTFAAAPLLNVHDLVVHADFRGRGIVQALLAAAAEAALQRGCCKLTLEVLSNNHVALAAYDRAGFRPYVLDPAAGQALFLQKWLSSPAEVHD